MAEERIEDRGLVFPTDGKLNVRGQPMHPIGISLRDYFAAHALAAYLGGASANAESTRAAMNSADRAGIGIHQFFAEGAFKFADAMLDARLSAPSKKGGAS